MIAYYQKALNCGEVIDPGKMSEFIEREMASYYVELKQMLEENRLCENSGTHSPYEVKRSKTLYRRLAKLIHPDINPAAAESEELQGLWNRLKIAYDCNDLKEMEETEVLINMLLEKMDLGTAEITIPDIEEKIAELEAEIRNITGTDPYQYKFLLEDEDAVSRKKEELRREREEYEEYGKQLDSILKELLQKGVTTKCRMN